MLFLEWLWFQLFVFLSDYEQLLERYLFFSDYSSLGSLQRVMTVDDATTVGNKMRERQGGC